MKWCPTRPGPGWPGLLQKPQNRIWVAEKAGQVTAYLHGADYETCYPRSQKNLISLAVDPACQGMGHGAAPCCRRPRHGPAGKSATACARSPARCAPAPTPFYLACGYHLRKEYKNFEKLF